MKFRHFLGLMILAVVATVGAIACGGTTDEAEPAAAETAPSGDAEAADETADEAADPPPVF